MKTNHLRDIEIQRDKLIDEIDSLKTLATETKTDEFYEIKEEINKLIKAKKLVKSAKKALRN